MSYIGNTATQQAFSPAIDYFSGNGSATSFTLSRAVASVAQVQVVIENVPQNPTDAFTVSGNTITFTSAPPSGTNNIYVYYTSPITQLIQPGYGTVGQEQLKSDALTPAAISDKANTSTGSLSIPVGTTAQRPGTPATGMIRMNSTTGRPEWYDTSSSSWVNFNSAPTYSIEYLLVAGGGGGGRQAGGGGGAGGYLSGTYTATADTAYAIVVGAGGAGQTSGAAPSSGNGSVSTGLGLTAIGGGGGAGYNDNYATKSGASGGSGGGTWSNTGSGGSGTSGQGNAGSNGVPNGSYYDETSGGGGGASAVGGTGNSSQSGNGGAGSTWSNGTTYAGGGGGGGANGKNGGSGGSGGGGAGGGAGATSGTAGTANTGGGGGGSGMAVGAGTGTAAAGGSGIVIIRYAGSQRGTGGTVTSSGGYTYHTFTTSGTYTA